MKTIFDKNIEALRTKNAELADRLLKHIPDDIPQLVKENNFYNLKYKNKLIHNQYNPLNEAKEIFTMAENTPVAIHLVFGLGLGYLFQVTSANSIGTVILYEPDLNILKISFTFVDFSKDILKSNVFITDNLETTEEYIYKNSNTKNTPLLLTTLEYRELYKEKFDGMVSELQRTIGTYGLDRNYTQEKFFPVLSQIIRNIPILINEIPFIKLKDAYKGKTAVVVSAGPTLDRNIETIKKYRENIVLIAVGTAMRALAQHNIVPDFLSIIEFNDCTKQIEGLDLSDINFISEPFTHPNVKNFKFKNSFLHTSSNMPVNEFWKDISSTDTSEYYSKGTVSYTALNAARILGCSKIVLVGQDLAYIEGQCYSKDSAYKDLVCKYDEESKKWKIAAKDFDSYSKSLCNNADKSIQDRIARERIDALNKSLYYVKGINGDMIPTESVYAAFIKPLSEFTKKFQNIEYINTSLLGAQIDGFKNITLEEALVNTTKIENLNVSLKTDYDKFLISKNLFTINENLKQIKYLIEELEKNCRNLNNDIHRYRNITVEILQKLKKLLAAYSILSSDYTHKNKVFDYITASERIDIDYEIKMTREFSISSVTNLVTKINEYCKNAANKLDSTTILIDNVIGELK